MALAVETMRYTALPEAAVPRAEMEASGLLLMVPFGEAAAHSRFKGNPMDMAQTSICGR